MKPFLLLPLILLSGCLSRHAKTDLRPGEEYAERVVVPRAERQLERRELVLALFSGPDRQAASAAVWSMLEKKNIGLKIIPLTRRDALSPMLRGIAARDQIDLAGPEHGRQRIAAAIPRRRSGPCI